VPYDVPSRVAVLQERQAAKAAARIAKADGEKPSKKPSEEIEAERILTTETEVARKHERTAGEKAAPGRTPVSVRDKKDGRRPALGTPTAGTRPIGTVSAPGKVAVEGKVRVMEIRPVERNSVLAVEVADETGSLTAMFYGRSHIPGLICGARVRLTGRAGIRDGQPVMINPAYELIATGDVEE
jgi:hypothetical protein